MPCLGTSNMLLPEVAGVLMRALLGSGGAGLDARGGRAGASAGVERRIELPLSMLDHYDSSHCGNHRIVSHCGRL